jgi:xanthine dehydrogenase FAD-binding subunit
MFDITNIMEPKTLSEAFKMFKDNPNLKIIAGGTDILIKIHKSEIREAELLSLRNIGSLDEIKLLEDGTISIGAMSSFSQLFRNEIINKYIPVLSEAAVSMGGPQIRNMATIGGNICNGAVSADSAPTLFSLNAELLLESASGKRKVAIQDFYEGQGKVRLESGEILTAILISKINYDQMSGKYIKYCNRKAMDIAIISVAAVCNISYGKFNDLRIALGVAGPIPIRCSEAEIFAKGKDIKLDTIVKIAHCAVKSSKARDSWRGSKSYREHLIEILAQRAITEAIRRTEGDLIE